MKVLFQLTFLLLISFAVEAEKRVTDPWSDMTSSSSRDEDNVAKSYLREVSSPDSTKSGKVKKKAQKSGQTSDYSSGDMFFSEDPVVVAAENNNNHNKKNPKNSKKTGASAPEDNGDSKDDNVVIEAVKSSEVIRGNGGTITLPDHAFVDFPSGAFSSNTLVSIMTTSDADDATELFSMNSKLFRVSADASYMISMEIDSQLESLALAPIAVISIPQELKDKTPLGSKVEVFGRTTQGGRLDPDNLSYDMFVSLPSTIVESEVSESGKTILFALYPALFKPKNNGIGKTTYEAIFKLATSPGTGEAYYVPPPSSRRALLGCELEGCPTASLACPVASGCNIIRKFKPIESGDLTSQYSVGFEVNPGDEILSPADGVVEDVGFSDSGRGSYIIIRHYDGNYSMLYQKGLLVSQTAGPVNRGDLIAFASTESKVVNLQYYVDGAKYKTKGFVDPEPCIGEVGNVLLGDNGSVADDSFSLLIDDVKRGTTRIGSRKESVGVSGLSSGTHQLTILVEVAPDNVGTFFVELTNGWTFEDGSTTKSKNLPPGERVSYNFNVPSDTSDDCKRGDWAINTVAGNEDCSKWVERNKDLSWLEKIPEKARHCPCIQEFTSEPADGFTLLTRQGEDSLHPGSHHCMRSKHFFFTVGEPGQQCCYDKNNMLITDGLGAGSPDRHFAFGFPAVLLHWIHDVRPFKFCPCETYLQYRPPDKGENNMCPENPVSLCSEVGK